MVTIPITPSLENIPGLDISKEEERIFTFPIGSYSSSLKDLPSHVLVVDRLNGLNQIKSSDVNMVIWKREEDPLITDFFESHLIPRRPTTFENQNYRLESAVRKHLSYHGAQRLMGMYSDLFDEMDRLQPNNRGYFSFENWEVSGFAFHQDSGYSLNWTPYGPGTLWVPNGLAKKIDNREYDAPADLSAIRQFKSGWIGIYKGELDSEKKKFGEPLVHSRPLRRKGEKRALVQIYL